MFVNLQTILQDINNYKSPAHGGRKSRKVLQIHPITMEFKIWNSIKEASIGVGTTSSGIIFACIGNYKHAKGYIWRYYDEFINQDYIRCNSNNSLDIFNLLPVCGNLKDYIKPSFTPLLNELFKDIEGYEGCYQISSYGRVINIQHKPYINLLVQSIYNGYMRVCLCACNYKKSHSVHRLVLEAFVPNPGNLPYINHKDENKLNNHVSNLEWCTAQYNSNYGTCIERRNKSFNKPVLQIDLKTNEVIMEFSSAMDIERNLGFSNECISMACNGRLKTAHGFKWKFK